MAITFETALKLKEAGYPQTYNGGDFLIHSFNEDETGIVSSNNAYAPTLEELIEACGRKFGRLQRGHDEFYAIDLDGTIWGVDKDPAAAVADLWLNKKV